MMTLNQLKMHNVAPRGVRGSCVPTSLCFVTGAPYQDIEYVLVQEQPKNYRPDVQSNGGVYTIKLLGNERKMFGHKFTKVSTEFLRLYDFVRRYSKGTFLVTKKHHAFVVKDGEVFDLNQHDFMDTIIVAWKVEKIS